MLHLIQRPWSLHFLSLTSYRTNHYFIPKADNCTSLCSHRIEHQALWRITSHELTPAFPASFSLAPSVSHSLTRPLTHSLTHSLPGWNGIPPWLTVSPMVHHHASYSHTPCYPPLLPFLHPHSLGGAEACHGQPSLRVDVARHQRRALHARREGRGRKASCPVGRRGTRSS